MANNYFQFKQFKVLQDKAAMKVGTDSVLLGAWANIDNATRILDIGTGTGLLALMAAQRNTNAEIIAIDIDEDACQQAYENFQESPWADRLSIIHSPLQEFTQNNSSTFDYIISNPPFFHKSLKSENLSRNLARHNDSLSYSELFHCSVNLLSTNGILGMIIPYLSENDVMSINKHYDYNLLRLLHVKGDKNKPIIRSILEFSSLITSDYSSDLLIIEEGRRHSYSNEYKSLTKDFYLAF